MKSAARLITVKTIPNVHL